MGAVGEAEQWFERQIDDAANWVASVLKEIPDAQAMTIAEIVKKIQSGAGSSDLHDAAQVVQGQTGAQTRISDGSHDLVQRLESAWSGQGADAAREFIRPLALSADDASRTLSSNGQHIQTQADTFDQIRNSLQPLADPPPEKNWYDNFVPWTTDAEKAVDQYHQQVQQNRQLYDQYHQSSSVVSQSVQIDYGQLPDAQDAQVSDFQLEQTRQDTGGKQDVNVPGRTDTGGNSGRYQAPPVTNYVPPAASIHPTAGMPGTVTGSPGGVTGAPGGATSSPGYQMPSYTVPSRNDLTAASGYTTPGGSNPGYQPPAFSPTSFGPSGGSGYDPSNGSTGAGFGPVGGGFGSGGIGSGGGIGGSGGGAGSGGPLQAGNRVGAGEPGFAARPGASSAAGPAGASGAAGRAGMSGMGGGAHGGRGQGGEDEEHETKFLLAEDGDEVFGTDERTVPPVIGL
ncbi:hypothetical protein ORV05_25070 [Amycolatopsis cynarae]|uniref:PPE family domain-containing protein n=1 Tax=Amycolatopsis cynarae TaxID=2995223 RepID=A0ABY7AWX8_9PSEU|nr:hypothetical protein [Amycolatopsis sp. HUAS 11-8]WAL64229.1 hypothetical protein ORV05_25070 [Amycolatopsis sp. HUAS 11-8]